MKFILSTIFLFTTLLINVNEGFALTEYQIREICQSKKKKFSCMKELRYKRFNLLKGNRIEIPVIPYKK